MAKISVAIATFNEEENIADCLQSILQLADEIVVVDGSSIDKTPEIAKKFGAIVINTTNKPMFHINKNMAIDACRGNWILQLDADERVTPQLAEEIQRVMSEYKDSSPVAYWLKRKNFFLGRFLKKGGQYPDPVIRLFRRGKARLPEKSVHEQMKVDGKVDGKVGWLKNDLIHWATPKFARYLLRENRYALLEAEKMLQTKLPINPWTVTKYLIALPVRTFFSIFIRHKGFVDGWQGFVFALFSGFHFILAFSKYCRMKFKSQKVDINKEWK